MESISDLLSVPSLAAYLPFFDEAGFDDLDYILSMEKGEWEDMLDAVAAVAKEHGVQMKVGHRMQILSRLRKESVQRESAKEEARRAAAGGSGGGAGMGGGAGVVDTGGMGGGGGAGRGNTMYGRPTGGRGKSLDGAGAAAGQSSNIVETFVCMEGFGCMNTHWAWCFVLCIVSLTVSLFLLLLLDRMHTNEPGEEERNGGWAFLNVLMIAGFVMSGVTFCIAIASYQRNPLSPDCQGPDCSDFANCTACAGLSAALCASDPNAPPCCPELGTCVGDVCPDCSCATYQHWASRVGCPSCFSCESNSPGCQCGGGDWPTCDLGSCCRMPDLYCTNPCPQCSGARETCRTVWKILTCQCQISV